MMRYLTPYAMTTVLALAGCASAMPPVNLAQVAPGAFESNGDNDVAAINLASWALALPSRTQDRPEEGARAAAAVDYLAGELSYSPRWAFMSPITKIQMLQARDEVRAVLGVAPGAPSQLVVSALLTTANALQSGNRTAALMALSAPVFTKGPDQTLAAVTNLPRLPIANVATQHASIELQPTHGPGA
jgi:hypothetical protein